MSKSLSDFYSNANESTLNDCDREQVHLSGAIQGLGALMAVAQDSSRIVAATGSASDLVGLAVENLLGKDLSSVQPELWHLLAEIGTEAGSVHTSLEGDFSLHGEAHDCIVHGSDGLWIMEFAPSSTMGMKEFRAHVRRVGHDVGQILNAETLEVGQQTLCESTRTLLGCGRVNLYRFQSDWSGKVVAEDREEEMPTFLMLNFPAADIPQQARALYGLVPYRAVSSTEDTKSTDQPILHEESQGDRPVDLSRSVLRSVSPMHTAYLQNMGVGSTFSVGLNFEGRLWGLIACHSRHKGLPPFDLWSLARELGNAYLSLMKRAAMDEHAAKIVELHGIERMLSEGVRNKESLESVLEEVSEPMLDLVDATGFAFKYGGKIAMAGKTPPREFITELIDWMPSKADENRQLRTSALHREWEPAKEHIDTACGVLIQPVKPNRQYYMVWFRSPESESAVWAGQPSDKFAPGPPGSLASLEPRNSFEAWRAEQSERSADWTELEESIAADSLREVLMVLAELMNLEEENSALRSFAAAAAHDIKAPLRGIEFALSVMEEDGFEPSVVKEYHDVATVSAARLTELTGSILELSSLDKESLPREPVDLAEVLPEISQLLLLDLKKSGATIEYENLPVVEGHSPLILSLFMNLVGNALKFRRPGVSAHVTLRGEVVDGELARIVVRDNGVGIPEERIDDVFEPFVRLHTSEQVEGSGLGLAICSKIVDLHGGQIAATSCEGPGARIEVSLPVCGAAIPGGMAKEHA